MTISLSGTSQCTPGMPMYAVATYQRGENPEYQAISQGALGLLFPDLLPLIDDTLEGITVIRTAGKQSIHIYRLPVP